MKWKNKGHEFDKVYEEIEKKSGFYLFGAGDYGRQFLTIIKDKIKIEGFIDNDIKKQGKKIDDVTCYSLDDITCDNRVGIIITMSQLARVEAVQNLKKKGYMQGKNFFIIEEFLLVYFAYCHDMVYFSSIAILPSTLCNLNCRNCLNFNPFANAPYMREYEDLIQDIDLFFSCVDRIMLFFLSGGEPMLYTHIADILMYLDKNYGDRIDTLRTVTNGTVVPSDEVFEKLSKCNIEIMVDDYREELPTHRNQFKHLLSKLNEYRIKHYVNKYENWIDLAPEKTDYSDWGEEQLIAHRDRCMLSWQEMRRGKLYSCNYALYANVAGLEDTQDIEETFDLNEFAPDKKKELIEFRLGYSEKGYTNFCKKCRGFTPENSERIKPAVQVRI